MEELFVRMIYDFSSYRWIDAFMGLLSRWGYKLMIVSFLICLVSKKTRRTGLSAIFAVLGGLGVTRLVRWLYPRERPFIVYEDITPLIAKEATSSFPSEQALITGVFIVFLWTMKGRLKWIFLTLSLITALSRVYVGHHYLSDVIVGLALGAGLFISFQHLSPFQIRPFQMKRKGSV
ncbi:phosphatase PAP2 family protein [Halobacillus litoralis]|uniref:phosphatase PAP2 family protein n=1 Tax=Halobacillus litoralis TaxID=45668 RepID=UPI001CFF49E7|nr:phosphatase PAP2 family protein [Halobacillus litoralis]